MPEWITSVSQGLEPLRMVMSQPWFLVGWFLLTVPCAVWTAYDLGGRNGHLMGLMKLVWVLTVLYSGPIGLMVYRSAGRKEIPRDGLWRRAARSVAHCYSGCGAGEVTGLLIAVGLLSLGNWWTAGITFALAYAFGYALTVGPMVQSGVPFGRAVWDAVLSETPSIFVMEVVAIGVDLTLAKTAEITDILFWSSIIVSLTCGLAAAYPVNVLLIRFGVKEGMMDPRMTEHAHG